MIIRSIHAAGEVSEILELELSVSELDGIDINTVIGFWGRLLMPEEQEKRYLAAVQFYQGSLKSHRDVNYGYPKANGDHTPHDLDGRYWVTTPKGPQTVREGDWIVTGVHGEHYVLSPGEFTELNQFPSPGQGESSELSRSS